MSLVPVLFENVIAELVRYDLLLMTALMACEIGVPRLEVTSALEIMSGQHPTNSVDAMLFKNFFHTVAAKRMRMPQDASGPNGIVNPNDLSVYITSPAVTGAGESGASFRYTFPATFENANSKAALAQIAKKVSCILHVVSCILHVISCVSHVILAMQAFLNHKDVMSESTMVGKQERLAQMMTNVVEGSKVDLKLFFGGRLAAMNEGRALSSVLGSPVVRAPTRSLPTSPLPLPPGCACHAAPPLTRLPPLPFLAVHPSGDCLLHVRVLQGQRQP